MHNKLVVLPSRRASLFLRQKLQRHTKESILLPSFISQEELMEDLSGMRVLDRTEILTQLYRIYKNLDGAKDELDAFLQWGTILLQDFNEIDRNLIEGENLYRHLFDIKEVESWVHERENSEMIDRYLSFWTIMGQLYAAAKSDFIERGTAWQGLVYRLAAERVETALESENGLLSSSEIYFVGLNALTKAEEKVLLAIQQSTKARFFWDYENSYINNPKHEAGLFARRRIKGGQLDPHGKTWTEPHYTNISKKFVKSYAVSNAIAQCKMAQRILEDSRDELGQNTAIILNDEELLIPMLYSFPMEVKDINVTMGLPLKRTSLGQFVIRWISMQKDSLRRKKAGQSTWSIYHLAFQRIIHSVEFQAFLSEELKSKISGLLSNQVLVMVRIPWLKEVMEEDSVANFPFALFEDHTDDPIGLIDSLQSFIKCLMEHSNAIEHEVAVKIGMLSTRLSSLIEDEPEYNQIEIVLELLEDALKNENLDLYGEPLKGVQLMGLLESRALDFERLIILSVNEGVLPSGKTVNSYIPYDIKRHYQLPVFEEKDAIFAYHFYRILHRAKEIHLVYQTDHSGLGSGEPSRFVRQIEHEWPGTIIEKVEHVESSTNIGNTKPFETLKIPKADAVLNRLDEIKNRGFSPSALTNYLEDPVEYFFKNVLYLQEEEELEEHLGALTIGTVVHSTLETLFMPFERHEISIDIIEGMLNKLGKVLRNQFQKEYSLSSLEKGKNLLAYHAFEKMLIIYLKSVAKEIKGGQKMTYLKGEEKLCVELHSKKGTDYKLRGIVDRIDWVHNGVLITDYKTGSIGDYDLSIESVSKVFEGGKSKAFQILSYGLMFKKTYPDQPISRLQMISLRTPEKRFKLKIGRKDFIEEHLVEFEEMLHSLIDEILDPKVPFSTEFDSKYPLFTKLNA